MLSNITKDKYKVMVNKYKNQITLAKVLKCSRYQIGILNKKFNIDKIDIDELTYLYEDKEYNIQQLMDHFNTSRVIITNKINKYRLQNKLKDTLMQLYKQGKSIEDISSILGKTDKEVKLLLKKFSIWQNREVLNTINLEEFYDLYIVKWMSQTTLADYYNTSERTVAEYIRRNSLHKDMKVFKIPKEIIYSLYIKDNYTMDEIANKYGCSRKTINNIINRYQITERPRKSSHENKIEAFLIENNIQFIRNTRDSSLIHPYELDFYLYEYDIAIEVDGIYWHSTKNRKDKYNLANKRKLCEDINLPLINIFCDEIDNKFSIVENRLKSILKLNKVLFGARKTTVSIIKNIEGISFLNKYHIQGSGKNNIYLGAFYNNSLVSVMSFSKTSVAKGKANIEWELNRFASVGNIPGIASKLFSYFIKKYIPQSIISYSDKRWNTGNLYKKLGFIELEETKPNYWYIVNKKRKHRFTYTKQKLLNITLSNNKSTEEELAESIGLYRIYDCGNKKFIWSKK